MSFLDFIFSLPFPDVVNYVLLTLFLFLLGFGVYKFVKDWLPW